MLRDNFFSVNKPKKIREKPRLKHSLYIIGPQSRRIDKGRSLPMIGHCSLRRLDLFSLTKLPIAMHTTPQHVAFIMDGNRRWAKKNNLNSSEGHKEGSKVAERVVEFCLQKNIPHITLWALSTENWKKRSSTELTTIFALLKALPEQMRKLREHGVCVDVLGNKDAMPAQMRTVVDNVEKALFVPNAQFHVHIALNYGGRDELLQAMSALQKKGITKPTQEDVSEHLFTHKIPDVDLIVRTGGEQRLSGFMLWQSEYAELLFLDAYWPELDEEQLTKVFDNYAHRRRNFGA